MFEYDFSTSSGTVIIESPYETPQFPYAEETYDVFATAPSLANAAAVFAQGKFYVGFGTYKNLTDGFACMCPIFDPPPLFFALLMFG